MSTLDTDRQAWEAHEAGQTWAAVAEAMHYANGSVARRAAMRHEARLASGRLDAKIQARDEGSAERRGPSPEAVKEALEQVKAIVEAPQFVAAVHDDKPTPTHWQEGQTLYHRSQPKAKYRFIKWNRDGSAAVWGGEPMREAYHDYRPDKLSEYPLDGTEALHVWADANLYAEFKVSELAESLGINAALIRRQVNERPDRFRRIGSARFEVRDPNADRAADQREEVHS